MSETCLKSQSSQLYTADYLLPLSLTLTAPTPGCVHVSAPTLQFLSLPFQIAVHLLTVLCSFSS